jgi:hypothetical protein
MAAAVDHVDYLSLAAASSCARSAVAANPEAMLNAVRSIEADRNAVPNCRGLGRQGQRTTRRKADDSTEKNRRCDGEVKNPRQDLD